MKNEHSEFIEDIFNHAAFSLTEVGNVVPLYVMILPDDTNIPLIVKDSDITLDMYCNVAHETANEMNAVALIFVCEQKIVPYDQLDGHDLLETPTEDLIKNPHTKDYLTLSYINTRGEAKSIIAKIHDDNMGTKFIKEKENLNMVVTNLLNNWKTVN